MATSPTDRRRVPQGGPPLLAPALAFTALTVAGVVLGSGAPHGGATPAAISGYAGSHQVIVELAAMLLFGSAIPLAIWSATGYRRLWRLGVTAPGAVISLAGGLLAAASLALSGLATWTTAQVADMSAPGLAGLMRILAFATGGAGFVVPFALLIAGVSVPGLILRLLPRPVAWGGLVLAGVGMLSTLTLLVPVLDPLLPVVRFGGLIWLVSASVLLPRSRQRRTPDARPRDAAGLGVGS